MEIRSFMHRGCAVSMDAAKKEGDGASLHIEVAMAIEEVATGQRLFSEKRRVEGTQEDLMTIERALNHCAHEARQIIDSRRGS